MPSPLSQLLWQNRFVDRMPADPLPDNSTRQVARASYSRVQPTRVREPKLLAWSEDLAAELGITRPSAQSADGLADIALLGGNRVLASMKPYAARYGGHQFGNWAGQLGDGRAITLGEAGGREFQLKGAGPTPYSRRADGRAVLRSSLREYLCSEAMHALGVPTTRALSLVATGDEVVRDLFYDGNPRAEPGAIVCRVSPSFVRFGNFEILAAQREPELLGRLADLVIADHYPELDLAFPDVYGQLLDEVARRTARMIAGWMQVGFVHGVMNTDNMSILGLTIDYGPYGWVEPYQPGWTPNTTDAAGRRYSFGNQPGIAMWNLQRLCEAFLPLVPDEARLRQSLELYKSTFQAEYAVVLSQKLGLASLEDEADQRLALDLFELLESAETDYTLFFRGLCAVRAHAAEASETLTAVEGAFYAPLESALRERWLAWAGRYAERLRVNGAGEDETRRSSMKRTNPKYVPRNYLAQNAIKAAERGDLSVLERLMRVLAKPYDDQPDESDLAQKRPEWARNEPGCSALSCSS